MSGFLITKIVNSVARQESPQNVWGWLSGRWEGAEQLFENIQPDEEKG